MDFPFLVALLVTLLLANRTNNARLLLVLFPASQNLPPTGTYSITLCVHYNAQISKNMGMFKVFSVLLYVWHMYTKDIHKQSM